MKPTAPLRYNFSVFATTPCVAYLFLVRPLRRAITVLTAISLLLIACEKRTAKFHTGDKVIVKLHPETKGVVSIRMSPFVDDLYYLRVAGERDDRASTWIKSSSGKFSEQSHLEGPYYESQLALDRE
jgi:hypothetical protein